MLLFVGDSYTAGSGVAARDGVLDALGTLGRRFACGVEEHPRLVVLCPTTSVSFRFNILRQNENSLGAPYIHECLRMLHPV